MAFCCCKGWFRAMTCQDTEDNVEPTEEGPLHGDDSVRSVPVQNYDVFVNHRGPDVKNTLVGHLSTALKKAHFNCFVDKAEIQAGELAMETIKSAIQHSKIHIAIFSPRYAESAWCLDELLSLLECFHSGNTNLFLPIFFNVTPSDLRLLTASRKSCYDSAFESHASKYRSSTVNDWKKALHTASKFKGYIFPDDFQRDEALLVESIVSKIIEVQSKETLLHGPEHPVGLDEKLQAALDLMEARKGEERVQKFGVYGMGGLGKTTLATSIYNRIHRQFESAYFMQSVSEGSKDCNKGLRGLQEDMLQELLKTREIRVRNTAHGKQTMRERLKRKRVLIILDDVSEKEQLDQLMPPNDCNLGQGSQIVITTRDRQVLMWADVETCLQMEELSRDLACELFNLHAFRSTEEASRDPFTKLAEEVADACQGLPLAVEVVGSYLRGKDISEWEAMAKVMSSSNKLLDPQKHVTAILKTSFDALRCTEEKEIFLDTACFFFRRPKDQALMIWGSEYGDAAAKLYLENLKRKCLVKFDMNGELITMHDLLRDMGREIVDNGRDYWNRSHLWRQEDVCHVLDRRKGTSHVRGLSLDVKRSWDIASFAGMDELKLLVLRNIALTGDFSKIPQELSWFQLCRCPSKIPISLHLDSLVVLDLSGSGLISLNCANCMNLKKLDLSHCFDLEELYVGGCTSLMYLDMRCCFSLQTLPDGLETLGSLCYLNMKGCQNLQGRWSEQLQKLTLLKCLHLAGTGVRGVGMVPGFRKWCA